MKTIYRVTVEASHYDEQGELHSTAILFEGASPDATRLYGFAPQQVELALAAESDEPTSAAEVAEAAPVEADAPGEPLNPFPVPPEGKPTRKRRTKAEMAADKAAAEAAAAPPQATPEPAAPLTLVPPLPAAEPEPAAAPLMTQPHDVPAGSVPVVGQQPTEASPPAAQPFNPFLQ